MLLLGQTLDLNIWFVQKIEICNSAKILFVLVGDGFPITMVGTGPSHEWVKTQRSASPLVVGYQPPHKYWPLQRFLGRKKYCQHQKRYWLEKNWETFKRINTTFQLNWASVITLLPPADHQWLAQKKRVTRDQTTQKRVRRDQTIWGSAEHNF